MRDAALSKLDAQLANRDAELAMRDAALSKLDALQLAMRDAEIVSLRGIVDRAWPAPTLFWALGSIISSGLRHQNLRKGHYKEDYRIIRSSGLFDAEYYLRSYRDVCDARLDPILHFVFDGASELQGILNAEFDTAELYMAKNHDVLIACVNPFVHYLIYGLKEGR